MNPKRPRARLGGAPEDTSSLIVPLRRESWLAPLYVDDPRAVIRRRGGRLVVRIDGEVVATVALMRLSEVVLFGDVDISSSALGALFDADVPVVFLRRDGRPRGRLEPPASAHVVLRQQQLARSIEPAHCLELARVIVAGKIHNQRTLLLRKTRSTPGRPSTVLEAMRRSSADLSRYQRSAEIAESIEALHGIEGAAARSYYATLRRVVPDGIGFRRRDRREPDVFNVLTNYCSALLRESVVGALVAAGLDPNISFFHLPARGRPTLAFDLMEEWRPPLLDAAVLALLGLRAVGPDDLIADEDAGSPLLSRHARTAVIHRFRDRLASSAPAIGGSRRGPTYAEHLRHQCRHLRNWVRGDAVTYEPYRWR